MAFVPPFAPFFNQNSDRYSFFSIIFATQVQSLSGWHIQSSSVCIPLFSPLTWAGTFQLRLFPCGHFRRHLYFASLGFFFCCLCFIFLLVSWRHLNSFVLKSIKGEIWGYRFPFMEHLLSKGFYCLLAFPIRKFLLMSTPHPSPDSHHNHRIT